MKEFKFSDLKDNPKLIQDGIALNRHRPWPTVTMGELHTHDFYEIAYTYKGEGVQVINDIPYSVKKGNFILMKPGDYHSYYSLSDNLYIIHCNFNKNALLRYFPNTVEFPLIIDLDEYFQLQIEQFFNLLEIESASNKPDHYRAVHELLDMILFTISRNSKDIVQPSTMNNVLNYILSDIKQANFQEAVNIFHSSEAHFCRVFKREFSTTFKQYLTRLRMQRAKFLLKSTNKSIAEIYEEIGYNNNRTFFVDFKKATNLTPTQFRKQIKFINQNNTDNDETV